MKTYSLYNHHHQCVINDIQENELKEIKRLYGDRYYLQENADMHKRYGGLK